MKCPTCHHPARSHRASALGGGCTFTGCNCTLGAVYSSTAKIDTKGEGVGGARCSFCGRARADVDSLVLAEGGTTICDGCLFAAIALQPPEIAKRLATAALDAIARKG